MGAAADPLRVLLAVPALKDEVSTSYIEVTARFRPAAPSAAER